MVTFLGKNTRYHSARKQGHRAGRFFSLVPGPVHIPGSLLMGAMECLDPSPPTTKSQPPTGSLQRRWRADTGLLNQGPVCLGVTCETPPPTHRQMTYIHRVGKKDLLLEAADSQRGQQIPGWISSFSRVFGWASIRRTQNAEHDYQAAQFLTNLGARLQTRLSGTW